MNGTRMHSSKRWTASLHALLNIVERGGFDEANGCVNSKEFTGWAGAESISIVHAESLRDPIQFVSR
jgi:hypothetical protein